MQRLRFVLMWQRIVLRVEMVRLAMNPVPAMPTRTFASSLSVFFEIGFS